MKRHREHSSLLAWLDLFMNIAGTMCALFVISVIFMAENNTKKTDEGIMPKADFLITLDWNPKSKNDIDLWVRDPEGAIVGYRSPSKPGMFLDRDDTGRTHDMIVNRDGTVTTIEINQEVVTIRGYRPGRYTINAHFYSGGGSEALTISILKLQPFGYVFQKKDIILDREGQEKTLVTIELDKDGRVVSVDETPDLFVNRSSK